MARWWDLDSLDRQYSSFVERHRTAAGRELRPAAAFRRYVPLVTEWRQLPYIDPGLPKELLPPGWPGDRAEELFMRLHERWSGPSRDYAIRLLATE